MDIPFTGQQQNELRRDYDPPYSVIGLIVLALTAGSARAAGNDYPLLPGRIT